MRVRALGAAGLAFFALVGTAQASRVSDPRDMPTDAPDVSEVGAWHSIHGLEVVVKLHEPVPEIYGSEVELLLAPSCRSGGDLMRVTLYFDIRYADLFLPEEIVDLGNPTYEDHRTLVFRVNDERVRNRRWRCARQIRLIDTDGPIDRVANVRM